MSSLFEGPVVDLRLKAGRRHRVLQGHPWCFSNQLLKIPDGLKPGSPIALWTHEGAFVGRGYGHPGTLISARILSRREDEVLDENWLEQKIASAFARRKGLGRTAYRLVHGEGDGLPGLIVDRFGDGVVLAAGSAGAEAMRPALERILQERFGMARGLWKNDGRGRSLEGLSEEVSAGWGDCSLPWEIDDDGVPVRFDPWGGQKTGLFLDMWENRRRMAGLLGRGKVVDLFSYVGQWGLHVARAGANEVICVDRSAAAIELVELNAKRAGLPVRGVTDKVDSFLRSVPDGSLDGIVCDPPAFIKNKKNLAAGTKAYRTLFAHALRKVRPGGRAVLASCSHHLWEDRFERAITEAARWAKVRLRVLVRGDQSPCHPVPLGVSESRYLKCWLVEVDEATS